MLFLFLVSIICFFIPFAGYYYIKLRPENRSFNLKESLRLSIISLLMTLFVMIIFYIIDFNSGVTEGTFVPAHIKDGKLVPSHFK